MKLNNSYIYLSVLTIALPILYFIVNSRTSQPVYQPSTYASEKNLLTYSNKKYSYSLKYLPSYTVQEQSDVIVSFNKQNSTNTGLLLTVIPDLGDNMSFTDFSLNQAVKMFESKWKDQSSKTAMQNKVIYKRYYKFKNPQGILGIEIYLTVQTQEQATQAVTQTQEIGPLFVFDTSKKSQIGVPALLLHSFSDRSADSIEELRVIADTLTLSP